MTIVVVVVAVLTTLAMLQGRRTLRDARNAPHRMHRWLNRKVVLAAPVFLTASWLALMVRRTASAYLPPGRPPRAVATTVLDGHPVAVTGGWDATVRVWDLATGRQRGEPLTGHDDAVNAVATPSSMATRSQSPPATTPQCGPEI